MTLASLLLSVKFNVRRRSPNKSKCWAAETATTATTATATKHNNKQLQLTTTKSNCSERNFQFDRKTKYTKQLNNLLLLYPLPSSPLPPPAPLSTATTTSRSTSNVLRFSRPSKWNLCAETQKPFELTCDNLWPVATFGHKCQRKFAQKDLWLTRRRIASNKRAASRQAGRHAAL